MLAIDVELECCAGKMITLEKQQIVLYLEQSTNVVSIIQYQVNNV